MLRNIPRQLRWPIGLWQRFLHVLARQSPGAESLRVWLHKARGVRVDGKVFIGANVYIDDEYPENVTLHADTVLGISVIIIAHMRGVGRVEIKVRGCRRLAETAEFLILGRFVNLSRAQRERLSVGG